MSSVQIIAVSAEEGDIRLDRWFRRHFPQLGHGRLEKLLRTGQVRIDGRRARAGDRLAPGQAVRVPPLSDTKTPAPIARPRAVRSEDAAALRAAILYRDADVIAINKQAGLAVQGGTRTVRHLDGLLDALRFEAAERPRLVHRLDKDTSGVLLLARSAGAAQKLAEAFGSKAARKTYWAVVVGVPRPQRGRIDLPLAKLPGAAGEKMAPEEDGQAAVTYYAVIERAGTTAAFLALMPVTGRTHQLRAHCAAIGTPILGDGKYGGAAAHLPGVPGGRLLHLHARAIAVPHPAGGMLRAEAPLPPHMAESWRFFGFPAADGDPFADLVPTRRAR
ncbi:MAG TPA: RluA family pseudouridine synthase [Stellaceae bacterium]|nr:RluA family pseudouridine synthase [Stellaceae bacterium]